MSKAKDTMLGFLGTGLAVMAYMTMGMTADKQRRHEREAFRKLDLGSMTTKDIWDAALDRGRKHRVELGRENAEYKELVERGAGLIEISIGLEKCSRMALDVSVPEEVKAPILEHWFSKWWSYMGFDMELMDKVIQKAHGDLIEKFRDRVAEHDQEVDQRAQGREDYGVLSCSFCGKSRKEVEHIVAGPSVYICSECIDLCGDIRADHTNTKSRDELEVRIKELEGEVEDLGYELQEENDHT